MAEPQVPTAAAPVEKDRACERRKAADIAAVEGTMRVVIEVGEQPRHDDDVERLSKCRRGMHLVDGHPPVLYHLNLRPDPPQ